MKIRDGFVSNSSSASFVISKHYLNPFLVENIRKAFENDPYWMITENEVEMYGSTTMDNLNVHQIFENLHLTEYVHISCD